MSPTVIFPPHHSVTKWHLFQGDWVWLKKFEEDQFKEVKQSSTKIFTKVKETATLQERQNGITHMAAHIKHSLTL